MRRKSPVSRIASRRGSTSLILLAAVAVARAAVADPPTDPTERAFAECTGLPARDRVVRIEPVGPADCLDERCNHFALHMVDKTGARLLVFPPAEGRDCQVFPIGRADARVTGKLLAGGGASKVFALRKPGCNLEDCPVALALRGVAERPVAALLLDKVICDKAIDLSRTKLFGDHDSVSLLCRGSVGGGYRETRLLIDAVPGPPASLDVILELDAGTFAAPSPDEKRAGQCAAYPVGFIRVEQVGERPILRVLGAPFTDADLSKPGTVQTQKLVFDSARRGFGPIGAADAPAKINPYKSCRPRARR